MRLSWAHAAAGALTAIVAAGLLAMPSRLLGPEQDRLTPINLPRVASPAIVVAVRPAVVIPAAKPVRRPVPSAPVAQLASVVVHATAPTQPAPAAHKASAAHGMTAARVTVVNRVARHPLPTDEARAATHPTPAPTPEPVPVPAPAPAAPAPAPAPAPAAPRVLAYSASTVPQTPSDDTNANCPDDGHNGNGKGNGNGNGNGNAGANAGDQHGQAHGNGNGNANGNGNGKK